MPPAADAVSTQTEAGEAPAGDAKATAPARITELRVSANLMTLDTGIFCIFPAPGSRAPDPMTGLPGVRVTRCPGMAGRPEAVTVSTFRDDGWLDNTAALVRVTDGPAQVLVTIYQAAGQPAENAPRLQVLRLAGEPSAGETAGNAAAVPTREPDVMAHIQTFGDVPGQFGEWIGKRGSRAWIEGFGISDKGPIAPGDIEYQGVLGRGWLSPWVDNGKFCGSRGMALPLLGLNVRLKGAAGKEFTARYSATFIDGSAVGPIDEGTACESPGLAALESFLIELVPRASQSSADRPGTARPSSSRVATPKSPVRPGRR
ncbi:MAG: hypothetical protein EXR07_00880 [Acetobacteraceae bacterium]|nr:hypothetical protein [Acetobacteraceae bacterium]